jgi:hypothetical protein
VRERSSRNDEAGKPNDDGALSQSMHGSVGSGHCTTKAGKDMGSSVQVRATGVNEVKNGREFPWILVAVRDESNDYLRGSESIGKLRSTSAQCRNSHHHAREIHTRERNERRVSGRHRLNFDDKAF